MADPQWSAVPNNDPYYVDLEFDDLMNALTDSIDPSLQNITTLLDSVQPPASPQNAAVSPPQNHAVPSSSFIDHALLPPPSTAENSGVPVAYVYNLLDNPFPLNQGQSNDEPLLHVTPSVPFATPNWILDDNNGLSSTGIPHSSNTQIPDANSSLGEVVSNPRDFLPTNPLSNFSGGESSAFPNLGQGSSSSLLPGSDLRNIPMGSESSSGPRNQLSGGESSSERRNIPRRLDLPRGVNPPLLHMLLIRPLPTPIPSACCTCVTLRQIIFTSPFYLIKLEIHGSEGAITHALQESRANAFTNSKAFNNHKYRTFDFSGKTLQVVKWLLEYYCKVRKQQGFRLVQDPMRPFYDALCDGVNFESQEWDEVFTYPDEYIPQRRLRNFIDETEVAVGQDPLPEQHKRAANMRLADLRPFLHYDIEEAASQLKFCVTVVKRLCRRFQIDRWPGRKIKILKWKIELLRENVDTFGKEYKKYILKEIERLKFEMGKLARLE